MNRVSADWILPIVADPIVGGSVTIDDGRISSVSSGGAAATENLGRVAVLPGLVNAHVHLELSYLRHRIPPARTFVEWVRPVLAARRALSDPAGPGVLAAARVAVQEARATGTALMGDVSNTLVSVALLREAAMPAQVFHELVGFGPSDAAADVAAARRRLDGAQAAGDVRLSLAPHAPYSVSPGLFVAIREDAHAHPRAVSSVHLGESPEEVELLQSGTGAWRELLEELGVWTDAWVPPRLSPVEYLLSLGVLDAAMLVVHGVQFDGRDLDRLRALGATIVSCPRSNRYVGAGAPPLEAFYAVGVEVAFGTDSLASVADLNMFSELAEARRLAPRVPARRLLRSATLAGARALGFEDAYGSIEPGKVAALVAVRVPAGVTDVEEYLVSGVPPDAISWVAPPPAP